MSLCSKPEHGLGSGNTVVDSLCLYGAYILGGRDSPANKERNNSLSKVTSNNGKDFEENQSGS